MGVCLSAIREIFQIVMILLLILINYYL